MRADEIKRLENIAKEYEELAIMRREWALQKPWRLGRYIREANEFERIAQTARGVMAAQARLDELLKEA